MKPWIKMYRHQSARFRSMPATVRAYHHLLLLEADENGEIHIGDLDPVAAVNRLLANDRSDRRAIAKAVPTLIENGYLSHDGDRLTFPKFAKRQTKSEPSSGREDATTVPPSGHDRATTVPRSGHELSDNPPKSLKTGPGDKEKIREEGDKDQHQARAREVEDRALRYARAAAENAAKLRSSIQSRIDSGSGDPNVIHGLLQELWRLHNNPTDPPFAWTDRVSSKTAADIATIWMNASGKAAKYNCAPGALIAEEWLAFMACQANSNEPIHATPIAKFRSKFMQWRDRRDHEGLRNPEPYIAEEVAA